MRTHIKLTLQDGNPVLVPLLHGMFTRSSSVHFGGEPKTEVNIGAGRVFRVMETIEEIEAILARTMQ